MRRIVTAILLAFIARPVVAQESTNRLKKPDNVFFYPQLNLQWGYDSAEPEDGWGPADRGSRTQVALEWFGKDRAHIQRGYTKFVELVSWNIKFGLEVDPEEGDPDDFRFQFRPYDTWIRLATKWDRTSLWIGHKSIPYGHNPRLDPSHSFLPNQAGLDLSFTRDTGVFLKTPVSGDLDLEASLTAGMGDTLDYHGGWLLISRVGSPTYEADEIGMFGLAGQHQRTSGARTTMQDLTSVYRLGVDWVHKEAEAWKMVNQLSIGFDQGGGRDDRAVVNLLNSVEWFADVKWSLGVTHALRYEELTEGSRDGRFKGTIFATVSYAIDRNVRFRINPFVEYHDSGGSRDFGVLFQVCFGCGLTK